MLISLLCLEQKKILIWKPGNENHLTWTAQFFSFQSAFRLAAVKPQAKYVITTAFESKSKYDNELTRKQSKNIKNY